MTQRADETAASDDNRTAPLTCERDADEVVAATRRVRVAALLLPGPGPRLRVLEVALVFVLGTAGAFFRLGTAGFQGRIWAEDGAVFLQQALQHGPVSVIFRPYTGYLQLGPRVVTTIVYRFPLAWQGVALHVGAAAVVGALALLVYAALCGHVSSRGWRLIAAACVVAVPVGPETTGSISNLQWYLLPAALIALFWTPQGRTGWAAIALTTFFATTSSPFGGLVLGAAVIRWILRRGHGSLTVLAVTAIGFAIQTVGMVAAPPRAASGAALNPGLHPISLVYGYLRRVLGDGVFGAARLPAGPQTSIAAGLVVLGAVLALVVLTWRRLHPATLVFVAALFLLSVGVYAVAIVLSGLGTQYPLVGSRYFVAPAVLADIAIVVLAARGLSALSLRGVRSPTRDQDRRSAWSGAAALSGALVATAAVVSLVVGLVRSFDEAAVYGRDQGPSWASEVAVMQKACAGRPGRTHVAGRILPAGAWTVEITCSRLRARS